MVRGGCGVLARLSRGAQAPGAKLVTTNLGKRAARSVWARRAGVQGDGKKRGPHRPPAPGLQPTNAGLAMSEGAISKAELARRLGISERYVHTLLKGKTSARDLAE